MPRSSFDQSISPGSPVLSEAPNFAIANGNPGGGVQGLIGRVASAIDGSNSGSNIGSQVAQVADFSGSSPPNLVTRPYETLAQAAGFFGEKVEQSQLPAIQAQGAQSVTKDADGNTSVSFVPEFTDSDRAFNAGARQSALAQIKNQIAEQMAALHRSNDGNPAGFQSAAAEFTKELTNKTDPLLKAIVKIEADQVSTQHFLGLSLDKVRQDTSIADRNLQTEIQRRERDIKQLAEAGGLDTDEAKRLAAERVDLLNQRVNNPRFLFSPAERTLADENFGTELKVQSAIGQARRDYEQTRDLAGTIKRAEDRFADPKFGLSLSQQVEARRSVESLLSGWAAIKSQVKADLINEAQPLLQQVDQGDTSGSLRLQQIVGDLRRSGNHSEANSIQTTLEIARSTPSIKFGTPDEAANTLRRAQTLSQGRPLDDYFSFLRSRESGGVANPDTVKASTSSALGRYQITDGTWKNIRDAHPDLGLTEDGRTDPAQQEKAVRALTQDNADTLKQAGFQPDYRNLYLAHFLGSGGAVAVLKADPSQKFSGDLYRGAQDAIDANPKVLQGKTISDVLAFAGRGSASLVDRRVASELQAKYDARVRDQLNVIQATINSGNQPSDEEWRGLATLAPQIGDKDLLKKVLDFSQVRSAVDTATGKPLVDQERLLADIEDQARTGGLPPVGREMARQLAQAVERKRSLLDSDPKRSLDPSSTNLAPALPQLSTDPANFSRFVDSAERLTNIARQSNPGTAVGGLFNKQEVAQIGEELRSAPPEKIFGVFSTLSGIKEPVNFEKTISTPGLANALTSGTRTTDPSRFNATLSGLDRLYRQDPETFSNAFGKDTLRLVQDWRARLSTLPAEDLARELSRERSGAVADQRKAYDQEADGLIGKLSTKTILNQFNGWFSSASIGLEDAGTPLGAQSGRSLSIDRDTEGAFRVDYQSIFRERYAATRGDENLAHQQTVERIRGIWTPSEINGGALMKFAPEKYYAPDLDGSRSYLGRQIDDYLNGRFPEKADPYDAFLKDGSVPAAATGDASFSAPRFKWRLVPTEETAADVAAGRKPRYGLIFTNQKTGFIDALTNDNGQLAMIVLDDKKGADAFSAARIRQAESRNRIFDQQQELRNAIGGSSALRRFTQRDFSITTDGF